MPKTMHANNLIINIINICKIFQTELQLFAFDKLPLALFVAVFESVSCPMIAAMGFTVSSFVMH